MTAASRAAKAYLECRLLGYGVHAGQQFILECLWHEDGLTPGELAARIGVETPTITRTAQRMEATGLVRRVPDLEDARLIRVHLTPRGQELQLIIPAVTQDATKEALAGLSIHEQAELVRLLKQVHENLLALKP